MPSSSVSITGVSSEMSCPEDLSADECQPIESSSVKWSSGHAGTVSHLVHSLIFYLLESVCVWTLGQFDQMIWNDSIDSA